MALYRCAVCGSSKIVPETKQEGYNKKKGIWGAVLFGEIGALAGTGGNTVTYYHCGDCGQVLNYTMNSIEKDSVERCLANPEVFKSSLKNYKERYRNIEWEEKQPISEEIKIPRKVQISDIEDRIIKYMREVGVPVRIDEVSKKLGLDDIFGVGDAAKNLQRKGILKYEKIGGDSCWILVTDIAEMKRLALEEQTREKAKRLVRTKDYVSIIKKYLSYDLMTCEEIYECLKQNNHLEKDVLEAEKENSLFPQFFIKACMLRWVKDKKFFQYEYEDGKYRIKTTEELSTTEQEYKTEQQKHLEEKANALMPIIIILQNAKQELSVLEILDALETAGATQYDYGHDGRWTNQALSARLQKLEQVGIVTYVVNKKRKYYSIANIQQEELNKRLIEAVSY